MNLLEENQKIIDANAFPVSNGIVISDVKLDEASGYIDITDNTLNSYGSVHGGAYFTLADTCAAFAARSNGRNHVTQTATSNFLRGVDKGRITAVARVINRSRKFCLIEANVYDETERLLFTGTFNYFCVEA